MKRHVTTNEKQLLRKPKLRMNMVSTLGTISWKTVSAEYAHVQFPRKGQQTNQLTPQRDSFKASTISLEVIVPISARSEKPASKIIAEKSTRLLLKDERNLHNHCGDSSSSELLTANAISGPLQVASG